MFKRVHPAASVFYWCLRGRKAKEVEKPYFKPELAQFYDISRLICVLCLHVIRHKRACWFLD